MAPQLTAEEVRLGRTVIDAYLSPEDIEVMKGMLAEDAVSSLSEQQRQILSELFRALGYL